MRAEWASTDALVDAEKNAVALSLDVDSGPLFRTGELRIEGLKVQDEETVRNLAAFDPGTPATQKLLLDYQERLQRANLFSTATVQIDPQAPDPSAAPVLVNLSEQQLQEATFGVGVEADLGPRITVEHIHRRVFGWSATSRNQLELSKVRRAWDFEVSTHTLPDLWRNLVGGSFERLESSTDLVSSARLRLGRAQETGRIDRLIFVEGERSLRSPDTGGTERSDAISAHYHGIWREVDDVLLPTDGIVISAQGGGGQARSDPGGSGPFGRAYLRLVGFKPIGKWYGTARVEFGQVFAREDVTPPDTMRFRAGGESSVRGYEYRSLAPKAADGTITSGKVLFTASVEAARPILERLPELWGAVFVDAGRAANHWSDLKPAVGAGVGVRYRSPIGPVSVDLAYGEEVRKFRLHLSVGVTF